MLDRFCRNLGFLNNILDREIYPEFNQIQIKPTAQLTFGFFFHHQSFPADATIPIGTRGSSLPCPSGASL
jgi:hypothetical protein